MVDFSVFFTVLKLVQDVLTGLFERYPATSQMVLFLLLLASGAMAYFLRGTEADSGVAPSKLLFILFRFVLITATAGLLYYFWPAILAWVVDTFAINGHTFQTYASATILLITAITSLVLTRFFSKEPNNKSLLNTRQLLYVVSFFAMVVFVFLLIYESSFDLFCAIILTIFLGTECLNLIFWFYDPVIYIFSQFFFGKKERPCTPTPGHINRFAVIGCAHNEETVIGQLVKSVYATAYPKNSYDIFVICDNCTDGTAEVVRAAGAIAMERSDLEKRGKGFGLQWMFEKLGQRRQQGDVYDAYIVLDADNVVNESFLEAINEKLNEGHEIMQTYLGCKNPSDTWISASYSYAYWVSNALYQDAHARIGLSAQMGGTGMVIRPKVLEEIGWETDSLTEDLVLTSRYVLAKNRPCAWVHAAKLYDEKPLKLVPSIRQRTRWMQGHMAAMIKFGPKLFLSGIRHFSLTQLDMAFYLARPFLNLLMFTSYLARLVINFALPGTELTSAFIMSGNASVLLLLGYFCMQFYVLFCENYARYIPAFLLQLVFSFSWYPAIFRGLVKYRERYWVSTVHTRAMGVGEIREDAKLLEAKERLQGLDNLHRLPLGQILLKAAVITKSQLDQALKTQDKAGGFLGDIIVDMQVLSQETLEAYLELQQDRKEAARATGVADERIRLGEILLDAGIISQAQLDGALEYQKEHGGNLGKCLVSMQCLSKDMLQLTLKTQSLLDANFVSRSNAQMLISGIVNNTTEALGTILMQGGLISQQQLVLVLESQKKSRNPIGTILVEYGYINQETLDIILEMQRRAREIAVQKRTLATQQKEGVPWPSV